MPRFESEFAIRGAELSIVISKPQPFPSTIEFTGADPIAFVVSGNLIRRHLDTNQRSMVAAKIAHMPHGGDRKGEEINPRIRGLKSLEDAARQLNVGSTSVTVSKRIIAKGSPELVASVESGETSLNAGEQISKLPAARQVEVLAEGPAAVTAKVVPKFPHLASPNCHFYGGEQE